MKYLALLIALVLGTGCDVLSQMNAEIGYSEAELAKGKPKQPSADTAVAMPQGEETVAQRTATWWENAKTLEPREKKTGANAMVRCRIGGAERFTLHRDCLSSGGTVLR